MVHLTVPATQGFPQARRRAAPGAPPRSARPQQGGALSVREPGAVTGWRGGEPSTGWLLDRRRGEEESQVRARVGLGAIARGVGRGVGGWVVWGTGFDFGAGAGVAMLRGAGIGMAVGVGEGAATPARIRGRLRTTASSVGSGVGWRMAPRSAGIARGPPPQAAQSRVAIASQDASQGRATTPDVNSRKRRTPTTPEVNWRKRRTTTMQGVNPS